LAAIKEGTRVVLLGDPDQLPPVDSGSFFADLVEAANNGYPIACAVLSRSLRSENQEILQLAKAILAGDEQGVMNSRFLQIKFDDKNAYQTLWDEIAPYFPKPQKEPFDIKQLLENFARFRILSCVRKGPFGVDALNAMIKERIFQEQEEDSWCSAPILIIKNDKEMGLYNGDTGVLVWNKEEKFAVFDTAPENRIAGELLPPFEFAYCLSVHKSQGSEYEKVLLLVPPRAEVFGREILYTGVTRAKKELKIAADSETLYAALKRVSRKISGFHARLR
jgi:exodeoxyribonuclease V alpha subunit